MQEDNAYEIDLFEVFHMIKTKIVFILICGIIGMAIAGIISAFIITPQYASTSKIYILAKNNSESSAVSSYYDVQTGNLLASDYVELVKSRPIVVKIINDMKLNMSYDTMLKKITVKNPNNTRILEITVKDKNPTVAKEITNRFATETKKQVSKITQTEEAAIVESGISDNTPVNSNNCSYLIIGLIIGLLLSGLFVVIRYMKDDTIKGADDVQRYLGLNTLSVIPLKSDSDKKINKFIK